MSLLWTTPHFFFKKFPQQEEFHGFFFHLFGVALKQRWIHRWIVEALVVTLFCRARRLGAPKTFKQTNPFKLTRGYHATHIKGVNKKGRDILEGWIFPRMDGYVVLITMVNK